MAEPYKHNPHAPPHLNEQARREAIERGEIADDRVKLPAPKKETTSGGS